MGMFTRSHQPGGQTVVTTTTTTTTPNDGHAAAGAYGRKPSLMQRLKGTNKPHTNTNTTRVKAPRVKKTKVARPNGVTRNGVPKRKTSLGDKVSGAMMKMKGSVTHRPGEKAAGTRRMHGTDGRGSRRIY